MTRHISHMLFHILSNRGCLTLLHASTNKKGDSAICVIRILINNDTIQYLNLISCIAHLDSRPANSFFVCSQHNAWWSDTILIGTPDEQPEFLHRPHQSKALLFCNRIVLLARRHHATREGRRFLSAILPL
jgi:hypothetical protein